MTVLPRAYSEAVELVDWAASHAEEMLAPLGDRWRHTLSVVDRAKAVTAVVAAGDAGPLIAGAYLHDVGYAPELVETGFHPLDGARHLRRLGHERVARLVAHHSAAVHEAELRGLGKELGEFDRERVEVEEALVFCDVTTGPRGERMTLEERVAEVLSRYGGTSVVSIALQRALPELRSAVSAVEARLAEADTGLGQAMTGVERCSR